MKLIDIASYVNEKINSDEILLKYFTTTDSLLQNKCGRENATNLPPKVCTLTRYKAGDILIANIRPYLRKIWRADTEGGCSTDVLVFRAKDGHSPLFLYAALMQDSFFDFAMKGSKGSKMPRGDKEQIMTFQVPTFSPKDEENIGTYICNINKKIALNRAINHNLPPLDRSLRGEEVRLAA